jgi:hypothetical protein
MIFLLLNLYILASHYLFLSRSGISILRDKLIGISITFSCQIILTQTILGSLGLLSANYLTILNAIISSGLILICFSNEGNKQLLIKEDFKTLCNFFRSILTPYNVFLIILTIIASIWIILSAFLLPPRGVDDLTYHLPAIFEYINMKEIFLLPTNFKVHFAFPMNAELLFMWPLNFIKSTTSLGLIQFIYSIIGMFVIFGLGRTLGIPRKISFFCSQLFFLTPLVLLQSGSGYIEIISGVFVLLSLYTLIRFYESKETIHLYLFGISIGLMIGMKYTMLLNFLIFCILVTPQLLKIGKKEIVLFIAIIFICCGYWYFRNLIEFGNPIYPLLSPEANTINLPKADSFYNQLIYFCTKIKLLFTKDDGIGSLHGGFGLYFWGIAIPSWVYLFIRCLRINTKKRTTEIIIWSQLLIGIIILILIPLDRLKFQARYLLFIIGIGSLAIGSAISFFNNNRTYKLLIIILCCFSAIFSMTQLAISQLPNYSIDIPIQDKLENRNYSKMRYLRLSSTMNSMGFLWETLDFITKDYKNGLNIYFAMSYYPFAAPFYGSKLQNRVWNFDRNNEDMPDAFFFLETNKSKIEYIKRKFTSEEIMFNQNYDLIDRSGYSHFFLNKKFLENDSIILKSLLRHYEMYFENEIESAKLLLPYIEEDIPILTSHYIGFGLRYLNYTKKINNKIFTIPVGKENEFTNNSNLQNVYTINNSIDNYTQSLRHKLIYDNEIIALIHNISDKNKQNNNGK